MCCAIVALGMTLLASWRSVSGTLVGRAGRLRGMAIVVAALGAAGGSALAADRFAAGASQSSLYMRFSAVAICGHFIK
ncbi:hypothetical protein [Paraburkholderia terricola]|uniref:Uncharacterized protein n=1 Tax=Paraburkholderia terricola TaxID=169427 RepID=A0ABU1LRA8_9BURK|nr:hypothetical protein [Paraburkholderia terricola]MDR6409270.1 hypothetical protein [Paraburkholderia terricola]MDR6482467.1 hypothetical protein [Paraburkholderia terricola]